MIDRIMTFIDQKGLSFPLYLECPPEDSADAQESLPVEKLDLGSYLVQNPSSTFFVKVPDDSMTGAGINCDDLLVVDRSLKATNGDVVVAVVDGKFTVKRLFVTKSKVELRADCSKKGAPHVFKDESELNIWGVVKNVIHRFK